jgi:hypothetical protein
VSTSTRPPGRWATDRPRVTCSPNDIVRTFGSLRRLPIIVSVLLAYALLRPVIGFAHELTVAAVAAGLHALVATAIWEPAIQHFGLDPIYSGAAIRAAGGVQVAGFAIAGPIGAWLHALVPGVFLACEQVVSGAGVSMVAAPGAPAMGRALAGFGADVLWLAFGLWLFVSWRHTQRWVALFGLMIQAQIAVNHLLAARVSLADVDASGVPLALQLARPNGGWLTDNLHDVNLGAFLVVLSYLIAACIVLPVAFVQRRQRITRSMHWPTALAGGALACMTACSPIGAMAMGGSNWHNTAALAVNHAAQRSTSRERSLRLSGATPVSVVAQAEGGWQYLVDGKPETVRGVGYNPQYAALSRAERSALYARDFAAMHRLGINTIEGWFEGQFDSVTLDAAARNGVGVLMPFELNQDWDYTDASVRAGILDRVSAYVERYKEHPAVRMWAPGNENLHRMLYAHWVSQANEPAARARAEAFAAFLPQLVDRIHSIDPNHPVVYRDAEDVYLSWITNGFAQSGAERPWLVYGANVYSAPRLQEIIAKWPQQWSGRPLLISEFAPGGAGPTERPLGYQQQWRVIRSRPDVVLGGLAYTWASNGPEDLDRIFGLIDPSGVPTDGSLAALSAAYLSDN